MNIFDTFLINPIFNLLIVIYHGFNSVGIPGALGFAIIAVTILIRLVLWPLTTKQLKSTQKMAELKPHMDRIKKEHGHDKIRHQQEITKLYKDHGVNPLAGCLPVLIQIPVLISLYNVLLKIVEFDKADFLSEINKHLYSSSLHLTSIPGTYFMGFNLAAKPDQWQQAGAYLLAIPVVTGLLQFIQSKMMAPEKIKVVVEKGAQSEKGIEDTMAQVQTQMLYLMPAMIAFFSYGFPVGLSLYWNTFTIIGIIQQWKIAGAGSLNKYLPKSLQK